MCLVRPFTRSADILVCAFWELSSSQAIEEDGAGKHRELADRNVCATPLNTVEPVGYFQWPLPGLIDRTLQAERLALNMPPLSVNSDLATRRART